MLSEIIQSEKGKHHMISLRRMKAMGERLGGGEFEQKGKRTHAHGQRYGNCCGEGGIRGLNGNGKNTIKIKI